MVIQVCLRLYFSAPSTTRQNLYRTHHCGHFAYKIQFSLYLLYYLLFLTHLLVFLIHLPLVIFSYFSSNDIGRLWRVFFLCCLAKLDFGMFLPWIMKPDILETSLLHLTLQLTEVITEISLKDYRTS